MGTEVAKIQQSSSELTSTATAAAPAKRSRVKVSESMHVRAREIGEFILQALPGIELAATTGDEPFGPHETDGYGLIPPHSFNLLERLGVVVKSKPVWGNLWFSNSIRGADYKHWVFEVFGRSHLSSFEQLAHALSAEFDVDIHVRLCSTDEGATSTFGI